jgi:hypothetical protein
MGGVTPPLALPATRHTAKAHGEAGVTTSRWQCPLCAKSRHVPPERRHHRTS